MTGIEDLELIVDDINETLEEKDTVRELAMKSARAIRRLSREMIRNIQNGEDPQEEFNEAVQEISKVKSIIEDHPELYHAGFLRNGFQELAEAHILYALREDKELRKPSELSITPSAYLMGLADVVGEMRRMVLSELTDGDVEEARELMEQMGKIKDMLMNFDYPKAIVPIKNKQDMARSIVEKTRGDLAISSRREELREDIDELLEKL